MSKQKAISIFEKHYSKWESNPKEWKVCSFDEASGKGVVPKFG